MDNKLTMADIYRYLAQSLKYPELSWFDEKYCDMFFQIAAELDLSQEVEEVRSLLKKENWLEDIQVEYTRLFLNAVPHVIAPPYGSVFLSENASLYDESTEIVKNFYRRKGFELAYENEPPDYLIYELEFMALLVDSDSEGFEEFLNDLFRPWFGSFMDKVVSESLHPYFVLAVKVIDFFTKDEKES